jgi:hypothetical protein
MDSSSSYVLGGRPTTIQLARKISDTIVSVKDSKRFSRADYLQTDTRPQFNYLQNNVENMDKEYSYNTTDTGRPSICVPLQKHRGCNKMSEETRKERNRRLAKEFRAKKKLELQLYQRWVGFLQQRVNELQAENYRLRQLFSSDTKDGGTQGNTSLSMQSKDSLPSLERKPCNIPIEKGPQQLQDHVLSNKYLMVHNINHQNGTTEEYPSSPVSLQPSPHKCDATSFLHKSWNDNETFSKATDTSEEITGNENCVLDIGALVHF